MSKNDIIVLISTYRPDQSAWFWQGCFPIPPNHHQIPEMHPMLDCIDIQVEVPRVDYGKLSCDRLGEHSAKIKERVQAARQRQLERFSGLGTACNANVRVAEVRKFCPMPELGLAQTR